jgi:hypothetical protein
MAALTAVVPVRGGVLIAGAAVAASDTINLSLLGVAGALLEIINGNAASDNVTISDGSTTVTGAPASPVAATVVNGTSRAFKITPQMADPTTGNVTITHSITATVTYKLYSLG